MQTVSIPWRAYYDQSNLDLSFPDEWTVEVSHMQGGKDVGDVGIRNAFANTIGSASLKEIATNKKSAAIIIDDLSRPTPADRLLPYILEELERGKELYASPFPEDLDVAIFNAFPKDTEFMQAGMALVPTRTGQGHTHKIKDDATVVIVSASPEGLGWHSVFGPLGSLSTGRASSPSKWRTIMLSPGVNKWDVIMKHGHDVIHTQTWEQTLAELQKVHGNDARVGVFPCGAMQYAP